MQNPVPGTETMMSSKVNTDSKLAAILYKIYLQNSMK